MREAEYEVDQNVEAASQTDEEAHEEVATLHAQTQGDRASRNPNSLSTWLVPIGEYGNL